MKEKRKLKSDRARFKKDSDFLFAESKSPSITVRQTHFLLNNIVSLLIYSLTFFGSYYTKRNTFILDERYLLLFGLLLACLIIGALLSNKVNLTIQHELWQLYRKLTISLVLSLGLLSVALLYFEVSNLSRMMIAWAITSGFLLESVYYFIISERRTKIKIGERIKLSVSYFLIDVLLLSFFCYIEIIEGIGWKNLNEKHLITFGVIYLGWFFSAATTHKFQPAETARSKWEAFGLHLKFYMLIFSLVFLSVYFLQIAPEYREHFTLGILKYSVVSGLLAFLLFAERIRSKTDEATTMFLKAYELKENPISLLNGKSIQKYRITENQDSESIVRYKLQFDYLREYGDIFTFIERKLDLKSFDIRKTHIIRSADPYNITVLDPNSQQMIFNLHVINDQNKINNYLREINGKLIKGGVFIGAMIPNKNRYQRYFSKYPFLLANIFYLFDFIWKRAFPKLPVLKKIYFLFSKGKDRAISLAEGLGRLVFCGFEILDLTEVNNQVYFVATKVKDVSYEKNPYYSPLFKMKRVGKNGKSIFVYKLRTMHPYSELIQNFVYINNKIQEGGKFKDDFRIPAWGKFFRGVWIDELPMLYNLLKGDLKLVGVRPISSHYMSLYSSEHQELRKRFKPGLVPPFYADMPKTIEEIEKSEAAYLSSYEKHPFKTDFKYFLKALDNILIKDRRSA